MKGFVLAIQFMTRIPININLKVEREDFSKSIIFFPLVGLIIGGINSLSFYIFNLVFHYNSSLVLVILMNILITGGLHLDGLSDTVDGIFSGRSKERILEIMKDSRVGAFGVIAIVVTLLLRFVFLGDIEINLIYKAIASAPVISRTVVVFLMFNKQYARENNGLGDLFIGQITRVHKNITLLIGFLVAIVIGGYLGIITLFSAVIFTFILMGDVEKKIDGITGDILGANIELVEILVLLLFTMNFIG